MLSARGTLIHIHGVSVGEILSAQPLIERFLSRRPDARILLTSWTHTSQALARQLYGTNPRITIDRLPIDLFWNHAAFYKKHQPTAAIWIDSEIWPGWLAAMKKRGIPCHLLNGRMSPRSFKNWSRLKPVIRHFLGQYASIDAQSAADAERFQSLGAAHARIQPVNLKYLRPPLSADDAALVPLQTMIGDRPSILFAATHEGDETRAFALHKTLKADKPRLLTVVVPRHVDRVPALAAEAQAAGLSSATRKTGDLTSDTDILFGDTMGEMGLYYRLAPIVVIGKSFDADHPGGQSPIEGGQLARALVCGPYMTNFPGIMDDFRAAEAILETDSDALADTLRHLLLTPFDAQQLAANAETLCRDKTRAAGDYLDDIVARVAP